MLIRRLVNVIPRESNCSLRLFNLSHLFRRTKVALFKREDKRKMLKFAVAVKLRHQILLDQFPHNMFFSSKNVSLSPLLLLPLSLLCTLSYSYLLSLSHLLPSFLFFLHPPLSLSLSFHLPPSFSPLSHTPLRSLPIPTLSLALYFDELFGVFKHKVNLMQLILN